MAVAAAAARRGTTTTGWRDVAGDGDVLSHEEREFVDAAVARANRYSGGGGGSGRGFDEATSASQLSCDRPRQGEMIGSMAFSITSGPTR